LLWTGGLVSAGGDWVLNAALPFFVYEETGSTVATAGMIVARLGPAVALGSVAGVFVDRWSRKRLLVCTNLLQAGVVVLLLLVPATGALWVVFLVAAAESVASSFSTPAESALLPGLVGPDELLAANALNTLNNRIARLVGVPLGGALLAYVGLEAIVIVDAASFAVAALLIAPIRVPSAPPVALPASSAWESFWRDWIEGLRLVRHDRTIALLFLVLGLMTFGGTMLDPLTVAWVRDVLGAGPQVFTWILTVHAASGIVGSLLVGGFGRRFSPRGLIGWGSVIAGAALALRYNLPSVALALAMSAVAGLTSVASSTGVETLAMQSVRDELRGRVFGSLNSTLSLLSLAGAAVGGLAAEVVGIVPMLNVATALIAVAGIVALRAYAHEVLGGRRETAASSER
jgi:predicted MFS family arabinose efflux permease